MKKIFYLVLLLFFIAGCSLYRTSEAVIENNSDYIAYLTINNYKNGNGHCPQTLIKLTPHSSTNYSLYDNGSIVMAKPNRNFLKKNSAKTYEILNSPKRAFKAFNKTGEKIFLMEADNLFDKIELLPNEVKNIEVFTVDIFYPHAISEQGIVLKSSFQGDNLIITF